MARSALHTWARQACSAFLAVSRRTPRPGCRPTAVALPRALLSSPHSTTLKKMVPIPTFLVTALPTFLIRKYLTCSLNSFLRPLPYKNSRAPLIRIRLAIPPTIATQNPALSFLARSPNSIDRKTHFHSHSHSSVSTLRCHCIQAVALTERFTR